MDKLPLERFPFHLGLGATAVPEPEFTGADWYARYGERHADDGAEGRLVQMYSFSESWTTWEMHPAGEEAVICTAGEMTLIQELPDGLRRVTLRAGEYAINPRGIWHTADIAGHATAVFITAGQDTQNRPR
jgi:quercetin dioxygenase-like cupin family protein